MNDIPVNNWALGLALFSFGFLSMGSVLFGATVTTAILRGFGGGILFGALLWLAGKMVNKEESRKDNAVLEKEGIQELESDAAEAEPAELGGK